ncbi:hypothetical protein BJ138DRAFT_1153612 [Hygrophoropsis aurantiaca]|uniref:Uncharacterized protein n=1 Tax=Hygrophoropsis aurantiaca TaxID=72124 RepID=A0ACB8A9Q0_9AGAM|nr:hypothetical protein BJ138DRAFT_1153612 [Hygrophoropsis aurantiaca]
MAVLAPLPSYPSTQTRKAFSAAQLATFNQNILFALSEVIALPPAKRDVSATRNFLSTYLADAAHQTLQNLIWENSAETNDKAVRKGVLLLAEKLAVSPSSLNVKTLLDIAVVYAPHNSSRLRSLFETCNSNVPSLPETFKAEVVPAFITLLGPAQSSGLYGLRKTSRCLVSLLNSSPIAFRRAFVHNKDLILSLARAYDEGLKAIAMSYGGIRTSTTGRELDDWERIWMETKVDLMDSFHILVSTMLSDISSASGTALATESERTFGIVFALLDTVPSASTQNAAFSSSSTPFLDRSLVADYQHTYDLARVLSSTLRRAAREDKRLDAIESALRAFDSAPSNASGSKDAGALKLLIRSSGAAPDIILGRKTSTDARQDEKGKAKEMPRHPKIAEDPDLDLKVAQVLDIFPDQSPGYIQALLTYPDFPFHGDAEKVIEALLEGTAPSEDIIAGLESTSTNTASTQIVPPIHEPITRENVFDDVAMDMAGLHLGKKRQNEATFLKDRSYIEQMKADILRRAEAMSDDEEDEAGNSAGGLRANADADDDTDFDAITQVKVVGDGEESDEEQQEGDGDGDDEEKPDLQTVLELAYIQNANVFDRDARKGKARADLKTQTGWSDEQLEGWRIMLDRNPKKDRILQKHEFSGNKPMQSMSGPSGSNSSPQDGNRDGGNGPRGRGGGRARGRGRGGARGGGGGGGGDSGNRDGEAKDRAWKDKNKASRGNHNRKRGHDKKMRAAGGAPT